MSGNWLVLKILQAAASLVPSVGTALAKLLEVPSELLDFAIENYEYRGFTVNGIIEGVSWGIMNNKILPWIKKMTGLTLTEEHARLFGTAILNVLKYYIGYSRGIAGSEARSELMEPYWEIYYESIIPIFSKTQSKIAKIMFADVRTNLVPMHGSVVAYFPKYINGEAHRDVVWLSVANHDTSGKDVLMDHLAKKQRNWIGVKHWPEVYVKDVGWTGSKLTVRRGGYAARRGMVVVDYSMARAFIDVMKVKRKPYNLFNNNCQDIAQILVNYLSRNEIPEQWKTPETEKIMLSAVLYDPILGLGSDDMDKFSKILVS
jgi:hypothetical protein